MKLRDRQPAGWFINGKEILREASEVEGDLSVLRTHGLS